MDREISIRELVSRRRRHEKSWLVENHGADPDILVENDPASAMAGRDKQLETAIEVLMKKIKEEPFVFPEKPPYPKK